MIAKGLCVVIPDAIKAGVYKLGKDDTVEAKAERLAAQIENAVNGTSPDLQEYSKQCRTIFSNLKTNQELCNGLLTGSLTAAALAVMSTDDMASKELKQETAEMKARADKQSIMITDDGPRIRRTHKGDEMIEGDQVAISSDTPSMSAGRRRSMLDPNGDMAARSRENSPGDQVELPADIDSYKSTDDIRGQAMPKQPLNIATKPSQVRKQSSASNFDLNKVLSSVQSPTSPQGFNRRASGISNNAPPANGPGVDPEIDRLLQDEDTPPYSPAEYDSDPQVIWRGSINMSPVAEFAATAKHIAGFDMHKIVPWSELLPKELKVAGRIHSERANEYLCSLRYSPQTDLIVVKVSPTSNPASQEGFRDLYDYFQSKDRFGVLQSRSPVGNIRDTYLVPVPETGHPIPDFLTNLQDSKIGDGYDRSEPGLLIAFVIRHELPDRQSQTPQDASMIDPPAIASHHRVISQTNPNGPQMSPIGPLQGGSFQAHPSHPQNNYASPPPNQPQPKSETPVDRDIAQRQAELRAAQILGEHVRAPTIAFLMPQAWQMREVEWEIIKEILASDEKSRVDLTWLNTMLTERLGGN